MSLSKKLVVAFAFGLATILGGCAAAPVEEPSGESSDALMNNGGGGTTSKSCEDKYGDCYIDCSLNGGPYEDGCYDSCDAAYRLCKAYPLRTGGARGVATGSTAVAAP
jgi:hypothetical protein